MIVSPPSFAKEYRKWLAAFAFAAVGHWSLVWALGEKSQPVPEPLAMSAVMLNFAELPQSSMQIEPVAIGKPQQVTPDSVATPPEPQPVELNEPPKIAVEESPVEKAEIVLKKQPKLQQKPKEKPKLEPKEKPKKVVKKPLEKPVRTPNENAKPTENARQAKVSEVNSQASAASTAAAPKGNDSQIAAPHDSVSSSKNQAQNWQAKVLGHLSRHLQYPVTAQQNSIEGTPWVLIQVDGNGTVRNVSLRKSSGANVLDNEALALAKRASPLPAPPAALLKGDSISFSVPIRFNLNEFKKRKG